MMHIKNREVRMNFLLRDFFLRIEILSFIGVISVLSVIGCGKNHNKIIDAMNERKTGEVSFGKMVYLESKQGQAVIDFTHISTNRVEYRWVYWPKGVREKKVSGRGVAEEKCLQIAKNDKHTFEFDLGSNYYLKVGPLYVLWQPSTSTSVWIYYNDRTTSIQILPSSEFNKF